MQDFSPQVTFRLPDEYLKVLDQLAGDAGSSRHKFARQLLVAALTDNPLEDARNRIVEVQDELQKLREELWTSVAALLTNAGKVEPQAAKEWVGQALMR